MAQSCKYGYTENDLIVFFGSTLPIFKAWMRGQTVSLCDGVEYDYEKSAYVETGCGPHGTVYYAYDILRFIDGK